MEAFARYPHWYPVGKGPTSEAALIPLGDLHDLASAAKLVTRRQRNLKLSARGRELLVDPVALQATAAAAWAGSDPRVTLVAEAATWALWQDEKTVEQLVDAVHPVLAAAFTHRDGSPVQAAEAGQYLWQWLHLGRALGYLEHSDRYPRLFTLTAPGRPAALTALRHLADAPRTHP